MHGIYRKFRSYGIRAVLALRLAKSVSQFRTPATDDELRIIATWAGAKHIEAYSLAASKVIRGLS